MERCSVYLRKDSIYVALVSFTEFGVPIAFPLAKLDTLAPVEIGNAVVSAFNAAPTGIKHPQKECDWQQLENELYQFIGVENWAELVRTSAYVCVEREASVTKIYPHRSRSGYGFEEYGPVITCSSEDIEEIGCGVLKALKLDMSK